MLVATLALARVLALAVALPTVAVDMSGLDADTYAAIAATSTYKTLLSRLVEESIAVVDVDSGPDIRVTMARQGDSLRLAVTAAGDRQWTASVSLTRTIAPEELGLEVIHHTVELVRRARRERELTPAVASPSWSPRAQLAAGAISGSTRPGLLAVVCGGARRDTFGLDVALGVHRPLSLPPGLELYEWGAWVVGSGQLTVAADWRAHAAVGLGIWQQRVAFTGAAGATVRQARLDPSLLADVGLQTRLVAAWYAGVQAGILATRSERQLWAADKLLWRSARVRGTLALSLGYEP